MTRTPSGGRSIIEPETFVWRCSSPSHGSIRSARHNASRQAACLPHDPRDNGSLVFLPSWPGASKGVHGRAIVVLKSHFWLLPFDRGQGFEQPHAAIPAEH